MNIILFGAPGSGKGTQAKLLAEHFELRRISLGDILRDEVKKQSQLGLKVKSYMERGALVPDALVSEVISENINANGFVLDGYPRNLAQAETLDEILAPKDLDIDIFIYLDADQETIVERLSKRRVCRACGANYHLTNMPPKSQGRCDSCSGELNQRKDDNPETIKKRWQVFVDEGKNILDFYKHKGKLASVDGAGDKDKIFEKIKQKLQ